MFVRAASVFTVSFLFHMIQSMFDKFLSSYSINYFMSLPSESNLIHYKDVMKNIGNSWRIYVVFLYLFRYLVGKVDQINPK